MRRTVLVTGSSRGIGRAIATRLARDGYDLVLHCRVRRVEADALAAELAALGCTARVLEFDVSEREPTRRVLEDDVARHGAPYGVVCNAGVTADNAFPALTDSDWDSVLRTNLDGFYNVLRPLVLPMIQTRQPGRIVAMSSVSGQAGNRGQVNYSASKAGIIGAAKALAVELAKRRITVNCVAPGLIDTDMVEAQVREAALKIIPMQRLGHAEEVAAVVAFLVHDDAAYVTRQVIGVNGGML